MLKTVRSTVNVDQITGVLPVVNGGTGVTTSTGTGSVVLSAAPTLSGNLGLSTGNLVPATAAKGINFSANTPKAGMTSQLLNWYEEGAFVPVATGSVSGTVNGTGRYTRIGRLVTINMTIGVLAGTLSGNVTLTGLPFTASVPTGDGIAGTINLSRVTATGTGSFQCLVLDGTTVLNLYEVISGASQTVLNTTSNFISGSTMTVRANITYTTV